MPRAYLLLPACALLLASSSPALPDTLATLPTVDVDSGIPTETAALLVDNQVCCSSVLLSAEDRGLTPTLLGDI